MNAAVMKDAWSIAMLISGALFAAGIIPIAWERAPAWRTADSGPSSVLRSPTRQVAVPNAGGV